ncbi:MAG: phosphoglycolate phosphatase [Phyllobacteriaceae bacterium]|nr:phosphoglycolate phosphatase [Phyllobacteriaceae bacterium]MBA92430.1 phosphoglycolate phosphatase [Phyllobacteriaceae bacterium]
MSPIFAQAGDRCGWPQAIFFDLDGTLVDSAPDLAASVNEVLALEDHAPLTLDEVRAMIGNGVRKLVERAFAARGIALEDVALDARTDTMMQVYGRQVTDRTTLMPGAETIVKAYHRAGVKLGVVTNKPEGFTRAILDHFGFSGLVPVVVGGDTGPERKPAPDMLLHAAQEAGFHASRCLMVGDSPADAGAARAAGMACVLVRGGYTNVPVEEIPCDGVIDSLAGLGQAIERLKEPA